MLPIIMDVQSIGGSRPGHTRAKPGYTLLPMIKMWLKLSNFSQKMKVFYVDNPPCPGSFCVLQPPMVQSLVYVVKVNTLICYYVLFSK